jgi:hypothetical protein
MPPTLSQVTNIISPPERLQGTVTKPCARHTQTVPKHSPAQQGWGVPVRRLGSVHLDGDKAHLHEGPNISIETAKPMSCDACVCGVLLGDNLEVLDLGRTVA